MVVVYKGQGEGRCRVLLSSATLRKFCMIDQVNMDSDGSGIEGGSILLIQLLIARGPYDA